MTDAAQYDKLCSALHISANNRAGPQGALYSVPNKPFHATNQEPVTPCTLPSKQHATLALVAEKYTSKESVELKSC